MSADTDITLTDEQKELLHALNPRQQKFVCKLVSGMNQTQAYKAAGYKPRNDNAASTLAAKLFGNVRVRSAYDALCKPAVEREAQSAIMTREEGLKILTELGRARFDEIFEIKELTIDTADGPEDVTHTNLKNPRDMGDRANLAIKSVTVGRDGRTKYELYDRISAIKTISEKDGWDKPSERDNAQNEAVMAFMDQLNGNNIRPKQDD